jgi:hypothetical protein
MLRLEVDRPEDQHDVHVMAPSGKVLGKRGDADPARQSGNVAARTVIPPRPRAPTATRKAEIRESDRSEGSCNCTHETPVGPSEKGRLEERLVSLADSRFTSSRPEAPAASVGPPPALSKLRVASRCRASSATCPDTSAKTEIIAEWRGDLT